jgi:hypothetical protein
MNRHAEPHSGIHRQGDDKPDDARQRRPSGGGGGTAGDENR